MEKKDKKRLQLIIVIGIALLVISNLTTYFLTNQHGFTLGNIAIISADSKETADGLRKFAELKEQIDERYYKDISTESLMNGAFEGLFAATGDKYSAYYTPEDFKSLMESSSGTYSGIGVVVMEDEDGLTTVVTPYKNTPAADAGIQIGDKIVKVDEEDVTAKDMNYVVSKMKGEPNTDVIVTILRDGQEIVFDLKRQSIHIPSVESEIIDGVGYIAINEFSETTAEDFKTELESLKQQNVSGLIIDLRYNGGGVVSSAVSVADQLLDETVVVYTVDKNGKRKDYNSEAGMNFDKPVVVLVNEGSASASEIVAGALQDKQRATLIGTKTFGKGIVQEVVPLSDGSGYKLTIAEYFTPNGRSIHGEGLQPDVAIDQPEEYKDTISVPRESDTQLQKAIEQLKQ